MYLRYIGILLVIVIVEASCSKTSDSPVIAQLARGQSIYQQSCAITTCHGNEGEGIRNNDGFSVWPLIGEEFQLRNPNAEVVYDIVRSGGEASLRALTDQQIYDAIAYELSLNNVDLSEPLVAQNAPFIATGSAAEKNVSGILFPTPGNAVLDSAWKVPDLPASADNGDFRIRVTQLAMASFIGEMVPSEGESFLLVVFTLDILTNQPVEAGPQYLSLVTKNGESLEAINIALDYPITLFHSQTIQFEHGTSALAVFRLPKNANVSQIHYLLTDGTPLILDISF